MARSVLIFLFIVIACGGTFAQSGINYKSIPGTYKGRMPTEDEGTIESELELKYGTDSTGEFSLRDKHITEGANPVMSRISGQWLVTHDLLEEKKVIMVILNYDNEEKAMYYLVKADGGLLPLGNEKHKPDAGADCTLKRML